ncbi:hypothetical protein EV652_10246 [Kribbella steppae]|uniref:Uncharacterized protein n=1 Tax=Kribbella steppae TaxID=2512223 RepID=A0A4R2HRY9_9ACTN|nr:hypothetical protein EV652_10246 [Kribbella steppae]
MTDPKILAWVEATGRPACLTTASGSATDRITAGL